MENKIAKKIEKFTKEAYWAVGQMNIAFGELDRTQGHPPYNVGVDRLNCAAKEFQRIGSILEHEIGKLETELDNAK